LSKPEPYIDCSALEEDIHTEGMKEGHIVKNNSFLSTFHRLGCQVLHSQQNQMKVTADEDVREGI